MVLEILGLVVGIVGIILSGVEIYSKLWKKIKHIFGSKEKLRQTQRHLIESYLVSLFQQNSQLRRETALYYRRQGALQGSQWDVWDNDETEWD